MKMNEKKMQTNEDVSNTIEKSSTQLNIIKKINNSS